MRGLRYGIPKFIPLNIKITARSNEKTGINFLIFILLFNETNEGIIDATNIAGKVPTPKKNINKILCSTFPNAIAPAIAT